MVPSSKPVPEIPAETIQAAREVYRLDHVYMIIGERLNEILEGIAPADLDPTGGFGTSLASRLALVTAFQFSERIPDDMAAQATLKRTDWKFALHLPIKHPGYSAGALCFFRESAYESRRALQELDRLMKNLGTLGLFSKCTLKLLDPEQALFSICNITRLSHLIQAMKSTLSMLITQDPDWLRANSSGHWYARYRTGWLGRYSEWNDAQIVTEIDAIVSDIRLLLDRVRDEAGQNVFQQPEIQNLVWLTQDYARKPDSTATFRAGCATCAGHRTRCL